MHLHSWLFISVILALNEANRATVIDLSHSYRHYTTTCWAPTERFDVFSKHIGNGPNGWYATESFSMSEHCGTHIDSPFHFNEFGWKLEDIPLERLIVLQGVHINVSREVNGNGDFLLTANHLKAWENVNGPLEHGSVILINFGWAHRYGVRESYYNNTGGILRFPGISKDAAEWIVDCKKVYGVGVDGPSVDPGNTVAFDAHKILAKANIYILENVALNGTIVLPSKGFQLIIQPVKIVGGTGAPSRILAFTNNSFLQL